MQNPFVFGNPVKEQEFLGRGREVRRIVSRISSGGQSVAVTAEPGMGKHSLLRFLSAPKRRQELYGELAARLFFQYIDAPTFSDTFSQAQFWQLALQPVAENLHVINTPLVTAAYETCKSEGFGVYGLERLFAQMQLANWRLALMLDEFDNLLNHPVLNKSEFYGGLRSLASRFESLTLVTASRQPLEKLNESTQNYSRLGSPYFNFMVQIALSAFSEKDSNTLLMRGDPYFDKADRDYLAYIAGGHPFLLQAGGYALWEAYLDGETERQTRWENTARELLDS
ncbi:MAG: AAA-like domain-containing protein, partial [Anaerolineales bacterium]|nr:AAA-like domain-containing protein [Anaerolineales bacterium]